MAENPNKGQVAHAFDSWTTQYLKEALRESAPAPSVEAVASESMTLSYVQANLKSASLGLAKAQAHGNGQAKSNEERLSKENTRGQR